MKIVSERKMDPMISEEKEKAEEPNWATKKRNSCRDI